MTTARAIPPEGPALWTQGQLANPMFKLTDCENLSGEAVGRRLAEYGLKPWRENMP